VDRFADLMVKDLVNFDMAEDIFLYDAETGLYHDIKNQPYAFTLQPGVINNRYQITFTDQALSNGEFNGGRLDILQNNQEQLLVISNPTQYELSEVSLYDMLGKNVFTKKGLGSQNQYEFATGSLSEGIYIARIKTIEGHSLSKKVVIERVR
jgi:hypothetical protein